MTWINHENQPFFTFGEAGTRTTEEEKMKFAWCKIQERLAYARKKHPIVETALDSERACFEEVMELEREMYDPTTDEPLRKIDVQRARDEALDVIVTALRFWLGDFTESVPSHIDEILNKRC